MNFLRKPLVRTLCFWAGLTAMLGPARAADSLPADLRGLATNASHAQTWPLLRSYAKSQTTPEWSGWALFLVGYQEYQAQRYSDAAQDLAQAAQSGFSLADYAVFYQAEALGHSNLHQEAAASLQDFPEHFPRSYLRNQALALRAHALVDAQQFSQAIDLLSAEPGVHKQPDLELLLGQALMQTQKPADAVAAFQDIYYHFPASAQAKPADEALQSLRTQMGTAYPVPTDDLATARAQALFDAGRYADAQDEYSDLLRDRPASPLAPHWQLEQGRCLARLHRTADALQALFTRYTSPELEAQRLSLLLQVYVQRSDVPGITQVLVEMESSYADSPAYAEALSAAGMFYYRRLNWQDAARNYRRLWELFPRNEHLPDDGWRLAWCDYLLGDPKTSEVINSYLMQFPDSPRAAAALFWLGWREESQGSITEARALYALLTNRFVHSYYAPKAAARLAALRTAQGNLTGPDDSAAAPLAAALIPALPPPVIPPGLACISAGPTYTSRLALILQALDLNSLELDFLKAGIANGNPPPELRVLLAETYANQDDPANALFSAVRAVPSYAQSEFFDLPQEVWSLLFPQEYWALVQQEAGLNSVDPYLVMGLIRQESAFSAHALSVANARGLMQLLPETAAHSNRPSRVRAAEQQLYDPAYNIKAGCAYLAELLKKFDNRPELAMAAYNAGDFRVRDWVGKMTSHDDPGMFLESIPIPATRTYVELVLRDAEVYRQLLTGPPQYAQCPAAQPAAPSATGNLP